MSVAFRRESDEEHLEPKFERPIAPGPNLVTARGLKMLAQKVCEVEAAVDAATADAERDALKRELRYWHTRQTTAELAPVPQDGTVGIGLRVTIRMNKADRTIEIVGGDEADPVAGRIGFQAPLAQALIGGEVGERAEFNGMEDAIEILAIETIGD
ncbi:GreA/GreB family elongation factor [Sphingomonas aliaeris]|uniref:GreA/GreB family elongation factor n=1 Tax=Sphingomonas aliaeris TaxID=2759526 RepID=A0A974S2Y6_9SPHN|nr:GreA/GreB family elongation factor [Sphingomonas aliaeris]QQV76032.1 GreA/GreB family elongation factor [Sphingomonas aliaeris]